MGWLLWANVSNGGLYCAEQATGQSIDLFYLIAFYSFTYWLNLILFPLSDTEVNITGYGGSPYADNFDFVEHALLALQKHSKLDLLRDQNKSRRGISRINANVAIRPRVKTLG